MCLIISLRSTMVTGEKRSNIAVTAGGHGKVMEAEGVKDSFMFSILSIKNLKVSQIPVDDPTSGETSGLIIELIVLKRIFGLWACLSIISEKCLAHAFLAAVWKAANEFLKISRRMVSLSLFHFRSACRQACLRERVVSSSQGCGLVGGQWYLKC